MNLVMETSKGYVNPHLLIGPRELATSLERDATRPTLLDLRPAELFAAGHLPHAVHLDLFGVSLTDTDPAPLKAFLWMIEHLLAARGVSGDRPVVVYETDSGMRAARAFWFLELFGHPNVRMLDGGARAWQEAGLPLTTESAAPASSSWTGERRADVLATWRDVADRLNQREVTILDTRSDGEYCGTTVRAARGGAIPGAVHIEWTRNLGADGAFKPAAGLNVSNFYVATVFALWGVVISAVYMLRAYRSVFMGTLRGAWSGVTDLGRTLRIPIGVLIALSIWLGFFPQSFVRIVSPTFKSYFTPKR